MANKIAWKGVEVRVTKLRFWPGTINLEPGLLEVMSLGFIQDSVQRHSCGDWGLVDEQTLRSNETALRSRQGQVDSLYRDLHGRGLFITTFLDFPETVAMRADH